MSLKTYVPVMHRLKKFREDNKDKKISIQTIREDISFEKEAATFRCTIQLNGEIVAVETSCAPSLGEDKEYEKAATSALGRALALLGYEADDGSDDDDDDDKKETKTKKRGLGSKKNSKKEDDEKEEEESEEEDESEDEDEDEEDSDDDDDGESEEEEESEDEDESEEEDEKDTKEEKPPAKAGGSALANVMNKYGLNKK